MKPQELPVYQQRDHILEVLEANAAVVVESPTGSGKTTQLPIILSQGGYTGTGTIGVTQPRRIAALSVCDYIAKQLGSTIPGKVGFKMRFEDQTSQDTLIKIMTDGILLQELKADPQLAKYSVIMVDEAHERSLNIDFVLGMLKRVLERRSDFKVLVSSATINAEVFSAYFDDCPIVRIDAERYPVEVTYDPPPNGKEEIVPHIVNRILRIESSQKPGDILVFLQGERAIKDCIADLYGSRAGRGLDILPLYGRLSKEEQQQVFIPPPKGKRRIIVATNIAETSVTIDGVRFVIDSGQAKLNYYNPRTFTSSLLESQISKASANQRRGRAGRTAPGTCIRLFTKEDFDQRPLFTEEEIYRTDLSEVVLRMAELGLRDFESFDFLSPPNMRGILGAIKTLELLDAINTDRSLTATGEMMSRFPLLPRHSRMIVEAIKTYPDVIEETIIAASFLSTNSPYLLPQGEEIEARRAHHAFRTPEGDFVSYLRLLRDFLSAKNRSKFCDQHYLDLRVMGEIANINDQLTEIVSDMGIPIGGGGSVRDYLCAVSRGLIQFVCNRSKGMTYRSLTTQRIYIHPGSVMYRKSPDYIVAGEIVRTTRMYARSVSPIAESWLGRISNLLKHELAGNKKRSQTRKSEKPESRDTTRSIWISNVEFGLKPYKKDKKIAILPWEKLKGFRNSPRDIRVDYLRRLRGRIVHQGKEMLSGNKVSTILGMLSEIDLDNGWLEYPPTLDNLTPEMQFSEICDHLRDILRPCLVKPKGITLGFLCLETDGIQFWYRSVKSFAHAVSETIASLEALIDFAKVSISKDADEILRSTYKRVVAIAER